MAQRAVREYTHAVQTMYGDQPPRWLIKGGAVHVECLLSHKIPGARRGRLAHVYMKSVNPWPEKQSFFWFHY